MNNFSIKNVLKLSKFDIKNNRKSIIGWTIAIFAIMFLYMILFTSIQEMAKVEMESLPEELLQFMGMEDFSVMDTFIGYYSMIYNLIMIAICIFASTFTARILINEEKNKSIEFLYSLPVSRVEIYLSKLITAFFAVTLVVIAGGISTAICGMINGGETFIVEDFMQILRYTSFTAYFFMGVAIMLAGIVGNTGVTTISALIVVASYLFGYLSKLLVTKAQWLEYLSPLTLFSPNNALVLSSKTVSNMIVYYIIMIAFIVIGAIVYKNRDYNI